MQKTGTISVLMILMTGCSGMPSIKDVDINNLHENQALLLFSVGADDPCKWNPAQAVLKKVENGPGLFHSEAVAQMNNGYIESDFQDTYAKVHTIVLEPGSYDFWVASTVYRYSPPIFTKPIHVKGKEIKYVGEFYARGCGGDLVITINDKFDRDINFVRSISPQLNSSNVIKVIAEHPDR